MTYYMVLPIKEQKDRIIEIRNQYQKTKSLCLKRNVTMLKKKVTMTNHKSLSKRKLCCYVENNYNILLKVTMFLVNNTIIL